MKRLDPRCYQILALSFLLIYGLFFLDFDLTLARTLLLISTALMTQWIWTRAVRLPRFEPKSALISALSLCLLLRTNVPALAVAAAVIAISSKFIFRYHDKHIFNPTNFSLVILLILANDRVRTNGLLWSLAVMSLATPALDWLWPGDRYQWKSQTVRAPLPKTKDKETAYEPAFTPQTMG